MTDVIHVDAAVLTDAVAATFAAAGCDSGEAHLIADGMVEANLFGHDSHGVGLVPRYLENLRDGLARAGQSVRVTADHGAIIGLDGQQGFGQAIGQQAMAIAIDRARTTGVCSAGVANVYHLAEGADAFDRPSQDGKGKPMTREHISHFTVEFGDCDPAQIVFYPNYFRWMDAASLRYFRAAGVPPWRDYEAQSGIIGTPLVDASARFLRPASYGDVIDVRTAIDEWRGKSFVMSHIIRRGDDVLVEGREVRVFARRHPDDHLRIQAVEAPEIVRKWCE